ncbi:prepilin-type N-terminal cleavage/methylation domain-containing protein [Sulfitobacter guttiformis]|uniref:Type II secretion system protein H n=1 Tax=Sulfitobacter guttiformis TaxID=74349 RepID=A0A420DTP0_9RHOB|nr:prepilin-type N-terminal cleavage/methylation domain-containing protein [Sulfitobacter guttiformis]KIN71065.1 hypothetical protein Z949_221 [Sulfitobacter guttiformis KCTC 32187]RKE97548.1 type II secretion system protein H [Sulfitobacter guttiformis]
MAEQRSLDAGVTLIEILVVLVLIGVSAGVILYALPSAPNSRTVAQEADLLMSRLNIAAERSLIDGKLFRLNWTLDSYSFEEWSEGAWQNASGAPLAENHRLADDLLLSGPAGAQRGTVRITPDLLPNSAGVDVLRLASGHLGRILTFDGASAVLSDATQ